MGIILRTFINIAQAADFINEKHLTKDDIKSTELLNTGEVVIEYTDKTTEGSEEDR